MNVEQILAVLQNEVDAHRNGGPHGGLYNDTARFESGMIRGLESAINIIRILDRQERGLPSPEVELQAILDQMNGKA